jgi:hypothetical protein
MLTYPSEPGAVDANKPQLTVNALIKSPTVIAKRIITPSQNFLSDELFRPGTTESGVVIFNKAKKEDLYPSRGDVEQIEPGAEFPMVDTDEGGAEMALSTKFGAGYVVTDEARSRNQLSVIQKGNLKVRNALLRQDAYRCLAAFRGEVPTVNAVDVWTSPRAWREDILPTSQRSVDWVWATTPTLSSSARTRRPSSCFCPSSTRCSRARRRL